MKSNKGFTLIELVIVIIVLGILSATAVPKFINLNTDAKISTLKGIQGAIESTNAIVMSKAEIDGLSYSEKEQALKGSDINIRFGQMQITAENIKNAMIVSGISLNNLGVTSVSTEAVVFHFGDEKDGEPLVDVDDRGCYLSVSAMVWDAASNKIKPHNKIKFELEDNDC